MLSRLLIAYSTTNNVASTIYDYLASFRRFSGWDVCYVNVTHGAKIQFDFNEFDVVLNSYCARFIFDEGYLSPSYLEALKNFSGVRVLAVQDEYQRTNRVRDAIRNLDFHIVLTCVPQNSLNFVYPAEMFPTTKFITVLTGYVPHGLADAIEVPALRDRPIAVGYRGRKIDARFGRLAADKYEIGRHMREICAQRGIPNDIEWTEEKRLYGPEWYEFIGSCRTMLGTESGSNVFDFDGSLERKFAEMKAERGEVGYEEFQPYTEPRESDIAMGQISPRIFEAAALHTPLILLSGSYSGAIEPDAHYIELERGFGNIDEVLDRVNDLDALEAMAQRAHRDLIADGRYSYKAFVRLVIDAIEQKRSELPPRKRRPPSLCTPVQPWEDPDPEAAVVECPTPWPLESVYGYLRSAMVRAATVKRDYSAENERLNAEIKRLHEVYLAEIDRRDRINLAQIEAGKEALAVETDRLNAEIAQIKEQLEAERRAFDHLSMLKRIMWPWRSFLMNRYHGSSCD